MLKAQSIKNIGTWGKSFSAFFYCASRGNASALEWFDKSLTIQPLSALLFKEAI